MSSLEGAAAGRTARGMGAGRLTSLENTRVWAEIEPIGLGTLSEVRVSDVTCPELSSPAFTTGRTGFLLFVQPICRSHEMRRCFDALFSKSCIMTLACAYVRFRISAIRLATQIQKHTRGLVCTSIHS